MRTLTMNEIEEVGGGPLPVAVLWGLRMLYVSIAIGVSAYVEKAASNLADKHTGPEPCPAPK
jgi:hypothetical protein